MPLAVFLAAASDSGSSAEDKPQIAPYGSWRSPITAEMLVQGQVQFGDLCLDGQTLYWTEIRPEEAGRYVIVRRRSDGTVEDVLPAPFSARTLAHEYGGGAFVAGGGIVYFVNFADQRIWRIDPGGQPVAVTAEGQLRFADLVHDAARNRLIGIAEDHAAADGEPINRIVAVDPEDGHVKTLVEANDFYSSPALSPDGRQLAWLTWNHPNMPWDGTELYVAPVQDDGTLGPQRHVAGSRAESIFQPAWAPDGSLTFVSDRSNWWNLYREKGAEIQTISPIEAEFGVPQWVFGLSTYGFTSDGRVIAAYTRDGQWRLAHIDPATSQRHDLSLPFSVIRYVRVAGKTAYAVVSSPTQPAALVEIDVASGEVRTIRRSPPLEPEPGYTSVPEAIEFPTSGGKTAHAFYYPPTHRDFQGPPGERPPLIVTIHGGPTSAARGEFRLNVQYWTSRGFGVCDVNYGGSTGYGRDYRNRLRGNWGVVDVADAAAAALYLAGTGKVDRRKLLIRGGSAGGYTTLASLAFRDDFCGGASYYGVSDLALLARDTHKFESRYLDQLVGPFPEAEDVYRERSPIHRLEGFDRPVILLQGLEDKVVPPNQAEMILQSLKSKGVPVAYVPFEGEQHGFLKAENIIRAHEAELYFYSRVLAFPLPEPIEPVEIHNLSVDDR